MSVENTPTQQGGEAEFTPAYSARANAMAQIAAQVHEQTAADLNSFDEASGEIGDPLKKQEAKPETVEEVVAAPEGEAAEVKAEEKEEPAVEMVSIVVDGRSIEVPRDRIIEAGKRTLQKESAADRRLQEAVEKERKAQALLDQAQRLSNPDAASSQSAPSQDAQQNTQATKGFDPAMLDAVLDNRLYVRDAQKAAEKFKKDFPEIASDPLLMRMAASLEQDRLDAATALGDSFGDPFDAYRKHGETIKKKFLKADAPAIPEEKLDRKRSTTAVPAVNATAPKPQEKKPLTVSETIEEMRAARLKGRQITH